MGDEQGWFPRDFGARGKPFAFFGVRAVDVAEEPGIVIVEGDQPSSMYFGAELRNSNEDAKWGRRTDGAAVQVPCRLSRCTARVA
jgi:hypothetical protein